MLQFIARNGYWVALIVIAFALYYEWRHNRTVLKERAPEVALQLAGIFLAVALAFEQTKFDRQQQRLADAQTLAIAGATSSVLALEKLARVISIDYDAAPSSNWYVLPSLLVKASEDEKVLSSLSIDSIKKITADIEKMKEAPDRVPSIFPKYASKNEKKLDAAEEQQERRPWGEKTCEMNQVTGSYVASMSGALQEICGFLNATGQELPPFLRQSRINGRDSGTVVFEIRECRISVATADSKASIKSSTRNEIEEAMKGNWLDCRP